MLAYSLSFILIFLQGFNSTVPFPIALTSTILVSIAGKPGGNIGETLNGAIYGGAGVASGLSFCVVWRISLTNTLSGALFFLILASISSRVGQGFVFLLVLYFYAYIKVSRDTFALLDFPDDGFTGHLDEVFRVLAPGNRCRVHWYLHVNHHR